MHALDTAWLATTLPGLIATYRLRAEVAAVLGDAMASGEAPDALSIARRDLDRETLRLCTHLIVTAALAIAIVFIGDCAERLIVECRNGMFAAVSGLLWLNSYRDLRWRRCWLLDHKT